MSSVISNAFHDHGLDRGHGLPDRNHPLTAAWDRRALDVPGRACYFHVQIAILLWMLHFGPNCASGVTLPYSCHLLSLLRTAVYDAPLPAD